MQNNFLASCRSRLENVDCPWVLQMPDDELEMWLFTPGPLHNKALIWALTKIDPELRNRFHLIHDKNTEKEIVKMFACIGLVKSSESDKVMGRASMKEQESFWDSVLYQVGLLQNFEADEDPHPDSTLVLSSLIPNSNFWDLLEQKLNLLPSDNRFPPLIVTLEELQTQLTEAEMALCNTIDESDSSQEISDTRCSHKEESFQKDLELVKQHRNKIDICYKRFLQEVTTAIRKSAPNPWAKQFARIVESLHTKLNDFSQCLVNAEEIKRITASFSNRTLPDNCNAPNSLHDFIATVQQQISVTIASIQDNNELLES